MRENGLRAAAYVAVADLHPQLADLMLEALADAGVAAYASPSPGPANRGLTMPTQLPAGPVDRLWVDRDATARARRILDDRLPTLRAELETATAETVTGSAAVDLDQVPGGVLVDDDTWADIIASYRGESATRAAAEPADPRADQADRAGQPTAAEDDSPGSWPEQAAIDAAAARRRPVEDPEDSYRPPPPPPLPTADSTTRIAWACAIGGPLLFLLSILLSWNLPTWAQLAGVAALVGGFVTLVTRMRDDDEDEGGGKRRCRLKNRGSNAAPDSRDAPGTI